MKSISALGTTIHGNNREDMMAKINAMNLDGEIKQALRSAAGREFSKKGNDVGSSKQRRGNRNGRTQDKTTVAAVKVETLHVDGQKIDVYTGPHKEVMRQVKKSVGNRRRFITAAIQTYQEEPRTIILAFREDINAIKAGALAKKVFESMDLQGYSRITVTKAVNGRNNSAWRVVIGENLKERNVRFLAQDLAGISYYDGKIVGADADISTNVLFADADVSREIAFWPTIGKMHYTVLENLPMGARFSFAGSYGIVMLEKSGVLSVLPFQKLFAKGIETASIGLRSINDMPWNKMETLQIGDVNDISFGFKKEDGTYVFYAVGSKKTAVITLKGEINSLTFARPIEYVDVSGDRLGGTPMTLLPGGLLVSFDRNGSGKALTVRDAKELADLGFKDFPTYAGATPTATQAQA